MPAAKYNLNIEQGAAFSQRIALTMEGVESLSGYTAKAQIRERPTSSRVLAEFGIALDGMAILMSLTAVQTAALPIPVNADSAQFVYDVLLTQPGESGSTIRLMQGAVIVSAGVTRDE